MIYKEEFSILDELHQRSGSAFYVLDLDKFEENVLAFEYAFKLTFPSFTLAYPYKTNYLPALCKRANELGLKAEVSSGAEYRLALNYQVKPEDILVNGPYHRQAEIELYLRNGSLLVLDNFSQIKAVKSFCLENNRLVRLGVRVIFPLIDLEVSRFGFPASDLGKLKEEIDSIRGAKIEMISCHFSTSSRSVSSFEERATQLITIRNQFFSEVDILNIGGGFWGDIPDELQKQLNTDVPGFSDYAKAIAMADSHDVLKKGHLMAEPGSALVANCMKLVSKVTAIKEVQGNYFVITDASRLNLYPGAKKVNLPLKVKSSKTGKSGKYQITGYTCMENDFLFENYQGVVSEGDYLVFSNCGAYSFSFKPPFIRPQLPVYVFCKGEVVSVVPSETNENWINRLT